MTYEERAASACATSGISASENDMNVLCSRVAREISVAVAEDRMRLARALRKFAPDLANDLIVRHQNTTAALDDFLSSLNRITP